MKYKKGKAKSPGRNPGIETLIISVTSRCNLDCVYCHNRPFFEKSGNQFRDLNIRDFERICLSYREYLLAEKIKKAEFCFTGGEPLLRGIAFYEKLLETEKKIFADEGIEVTNLLQTNGLLLDEKWADFILHRGIKTGISCDARSQDVSRPSRNGAGTLPALEEKLSILSEKEIEFGFLTVVSMFNKDFARENMDWMISRGPRSIAFIPCLDYAGAIDAGNYGKYLTDSFDAWLRHGHSGVRVRNFHFALLYFMGLKKPDLPCENAGECPCTINVNLDGNVYICDVFMGTDKGRLGNIKKESLLEMSKADKWAAIRDFSSSLPPECSGCEYLPLCNGGCLYRRLNDAKKDFLCEASKMLFARVKKFVREELFAKAPF